MTNIGEIIFNSELKEIIDRLNNDFHIERIALTGGEPLLYPFLNELVQKIKMETNIKIISITTNGTIALEKKQWDDLKENGLSKVNISIPEILSNTENAEKNKFIFNKQIHTIEYLNSIGVDVDINIVTYNDEYSLENVVKRLYRLKKENNLIFDMILLPNINDIKDYSNSISTIRQFCDKLELIKQKTFNVEGTSNALEKYVSNSVGEIYIKTTKLTGKPFLLSSMCSKCRIKDICQEGFYGIRLESRNNKIYVRLCIHQDTEKVVMPFHDFVKSKQYKELYKIWKVI
jgi:molybdenum cofactor biosynthesis enzyme MoaA